MPPLFHSTPATMSSHIPKRFLSGWTLPASVVVHSLIAALLIFGLPGSLSQPQEEEAIKVDLVPPPKPEEKAKVEPPPAEKPKAERAEPEKPKPEKPKPEEKAKAEPSPAAEKAKPAKPTEAKVEKPAPKSDEAAQASRIPALRPVFKFGEKDAGPRMSPKGNSPEEGSAPAAVPPEPDKQEPAGPAALTAAGASGQAPPPGAQANAAAPMVEAAKAGKSAKKLELAKRLFSRSASGDPLAMTAMAGVPRSERGGQLCVTELREQLMHAVPPFFPEFLPKPGPEDDDVIEISDAFRAEGQWYDLSFRCEVDKDATEVVSFAFQVGRPIPPGEWNRRGFPRD
jgi:hypothetical protein